MPVLVLEADPLDVAEEVREGASLRVGDGVVVSEGPSMPVLVLEVDRLDVAEEVGEGVLRIGDGVVDWDGLAVRVWMPVGDIDGVGDILGSPIQNFTSASLWATSSCVPSGQLPVPGLPSR